MATKSPCDRCGKVRVLTEYHPNQKATQHVCSACFEAAVETRREASVTSGAGRPPKRDSQLETVTRRIVLTERAAKKLDAWLAANGFPGGGHRALKAWATSL